MRPGFNDPSRPGLGKTDNRLKGGFTEPSASIGEDADLRAIRELQNHAKNESNSIRSYLEERLADNDDELSIEDISVFLEALDKRSFSQGQSLGENTSSIENLEQFLPVFGRVLTINAGIANHSSSVSYEVGDFVKELDKVYICKTNTGAEVFDLNKWTHIKKHDVSKTYSLDEYVIADGYIFKAIIPTVTAGYFNWGDWQKITNAEDTYTIVSIQRFKEEDGWSNNFSKLFENVREMNGRDSSVSIGDRVNLFKAIDDFAGKSTWLFNAASSDIETTENSFAQIISVSEGEIDVYDSTSTYALDDFTLNSSVYICTTAITVAEEFTPAKWLEIIGFSELISYSTNDYILYGGNIYQAPGAISAGEWDVTDWTFKKVYRTTHVAKEVIRYHDDWIDGAKLFQNVVEVKGAIGTVGDRIVLFTKNDDYVFSKGGSSSTASASQLAIRITSQVSAGIFKGNIITALDDNTAVTTDVDIKAYQITVSTTDLTDTNWPVVGYDGSFYFINPPVGI